MTANLFTGIDVGTTKICTLVAQETEDGGLQIIGVGIEPSRGLRKGVVVNVEDAARAISASIEKAQRTAGYEIASAVVSLAGAQVSSINSRGVVGVSGDVISAEDVARANEAARAIAVPYDRQVVHVLPRGFVVDGQEGIRNPVGMAIHPQTGDLWVSVNERDGLGDDLVPDYITRVVPGGFYGWPWYYLGPHQDPRHEGKRPDLKDKVLAPDVLLQAHSASLALTFYTGTQFPAEYRGHVFAAEHGSWNRAQRTGYKVIYAPVVNGKATGEYVDFLTGFAWPNGDVWGRPVGVAVAGDGALLVSDDGSNSVWRVSYTGNVRSAAGN